MGIWPRVKQNETSKKLGGNARRQKAKKRGHKVSRKNNLLLVKAHAYNATRSELYPSTRTPNPSAHVPATPSQKRPRTSPRSPLKDTISENAAVGGSGKEINPIEYWRKEGTWPEEYFNPEGNMSHLLARKKSLSSLRAKQSEAGSTTPSSTTPSDQKPREAKSSPYARPSYET